MNTTHIAFIIFLIVILYIYFNKTEQKEHFNTSCEQDDLLTQKINAFESDNIKCLLDITNYDCKADTNNLYPLHIIKTIDSEFLAVFNNGQLYKNTDIESENLWRGPIPNSEPKQGILIRMITYNRDGKLLGVGTDGLIYIKSGDKIESPWVVTPLPNSGCVMYIMFDKDNRLLGINSDGNIIKKQSIDISSQWENTNGSDRPLLKIFWDLNGHMLAIGDDFKLYQKDLPNWEVSNWKKKTSPAKLFDIVYDKDGRLYGIYINELLDTLELRKQNQAYYTADFYPLFDVKIQGVTNLTDSHVIQTKMGTTFARADEEHKEESLNQVVDPLPEDLQQEYTLENQKKLRSLCADRKKIYNSGDYYDYELQRKMEVQDALIDNLKKELDNYSSTDKKYMQMIDKTTRPNDIMQLINKSQ
jgi:hypothetical protein